MTVTGQKLVVPDGGWGWIVVLGSSIINLSTRSIEPSFGLLFGDLLKELGVATTGASIIMSTLDAIINFSGLFVGPLIKKFSFRKVGILGALLSCTALILTSNANSMTHIILTYSVLGGLGFGLATASTFVALNSYFSKRRGQAVGLAMAGTALGFMAMPQLISILLEEYDFRGTLFILGALSLNAIVGASLLQPVKWHMKPNKKIPIIKEDPPPFSGQELHALKEENDGENECERNHICSHQDFEKEMSRSLLGLSIPRKPSVASSLHRQITATSCTTMHNKLSTTMIPRNTSGASITSRRRKTSTISNISHLDLMGSTMHVHIHIETDSEDEIEAANKPIHKSTELKNGSIIIDKNEDIKYNKPSPSCWAKFSHLMDLDLLKDAIYLNILFGLSITYIAELNFKMVMPFFMANLNYNKRETAIVLSVMAIADVCARVTVPPILDRLEFSRRKTLMVGCIIVAAARSVLAEQTQWVPIIIVVIIHGFFRGMCLINFPLVISEYVPVDKFAAAYGLSMVSKGIFIVVLGSVPGFIRDITGSYSLCIHTQSLMIMMCVVAWSIESVMCWRRLQDEAEAADLT